MASFSVLSVGRAFFFSFVGLIFLWPGHAAGSQGCFEHVRNLDYSPTNCSAQPEMDRVFRLQTITWKNHDYLFVDEGNEIRILNIDDPLDPATVTNSDFGIGNVGDSDYDLLNFSVCDDCRYGIASYKAATVLFDLGAGSSPVFGANTENFDANMVQGGFTFMVGSQQYLVAAGLGSNDCDGGIASALYEFNGIDESANPVLECIDNGGAGAQIVNGIHLGAANPPVIYMSDRFARFGIYELRTSPTVGLTYNGAGGIARARMSRGSGAAVDEAAGLLAVADGGVLSLYDIGFSTGGPAAPILISTTVLASLAQANAVALSYPLVQVAQQFTSDEPSAFDVTDPNSPVALDPGFWDPTYPWNSLGSCIWNIHTAFSSDGAAMYLSRYSSLQVIGVSACGAPASPTASSTLSPQPAFPGDLLTVLNTSSGGDRYATWITDGADPHGGTILAGSTSFSSGAILGFTLPSDMSGAAVYYAHAAVETNDFPYVPGSTPEQVITRQILVDRSPDAVFTVVPAAAITGDSVTLTATAEGHPAEPGGGNPYDWIVTGPSGGSTAFTGSLIDNLVLNESGQWTFDLVVQYEHDALGQPGVPYSSSSQQIRSVSSVAAEFEISPASPMHSEIITLSSLSAAQSGAHLDFDWDVYEASTPTLVHELAFCDGPGPVDEHCVIPAESLTPGVYDFRLTLTNTDNSDQDVSVIENIDVVDGGPIQIDFIWDPSGPEVGTLIGFQITGAPSNEIERAVWQFGGTGCDGSTTYTCVPGGFLACDWAAFSYDSGGTKTVRVTVTTSGGAQQPQISHSLVVQNTGTCGGTSCSYTITPSSRSFSESGGVGTINVNTQSGCVWTASEYTGWISITSGGSGSGPGTVAYQVAPNPGVARSATMTAASRTHTVLQAGGSTCNYALSSHQGVFDPPGGSVSFEISTSGGCGWTAVSDTSWLHVNPTSGSGGATVNLTVDENNTPHQREAVVTVTGTSGSFTDTYTAIQNHPWIPVNFEMSTTAPEIGETVVFTTDERLEVLSWSFTSADCQGNGPVMICSGVAGSCNEVEWNWPLSGPKEITLETTTGSQTKALTVQNTGECPPSCSKDGRPDASFTMNPSPALEDEPVTFTDTSSGGLKIAATGFTWSPASPEIGELVTLSISGHAGDLQTEWNFGENGCAGYSQIQVCTPNFSNCHDYYFKFASGGSKTVSVTVKDPSTGATLGTASRTLTVQNAGSCDGVPTCTYSLEPANWSFTADGGNATVNVNTQDGCTWNASTINSWIDLNQPTNGSGAGSFSYSVGANTGDARTGAVSVVNRSHGVFQLSGGGGGGGGGGAGGDTTPTEWLWTVRLGTQVIVTSTEQGFTHTFRAPGFYEVELIASNCAGSDITTRTLEIIDVVEPAPGAYLVPSAVHTPGLNETLWKTDLRIFNPGDEEVEVWVEFLPENTDNTRGVINVVRFNMERHGTRVFDDVLTQIPGIQGDSKKGSLRITFGEGTGAAPLVTSRTYNDTPDGTFGQFVRAVPVLQNDDGFILLTGLSENLYYRSNLSLANFSDRMARGVTVNVLDDRGEIVGDPIDVAILPYSTTQIVRVAERAGILTDLDIFSLYVHANGNDLWAGASIVDNATGDPVHVESVDSSGEVLWVPGIAHLGGVNNSLWRSDITFFNDTLDWIATVVEYFSPENGQIGGTPGISLNIASANAAYFADILGSSMLPAGIESKGYFTITSRDGSALAHVVAKTYNVDEFGGTFGQNLKVFSAADLIEEGESGWIAGVSNSSVSDLGFRTNVGMLNTNVDSTAVVDIKIYDTAGVRVGRIPNLQIGPGAMLQSNIFESAFIGDLDMDGSVEIKVLSGGPVAAYASVVDNRTQDPILIPAVKVVAME